MHNQKTFAVDGNLGYDGNNVFFADMKFSDNKQSATIKSRLETKPGDWKFNTDFKNTINPQANVNLKYEIKMTTEPEYIDSKLQIIHGDDPNSKMNVLKLDNSWTSYYKTKTDYKLSTKNHLSYPLLNVDAKFEFESEPKELEYEAALTYNNQKYSSELDVKINTKVVGDYEFKFGLEGFKNKLAIKAKRNIAGETSKIANSLEHNGKKYELNGDIKHHYKPKDVNVGADLTLKVAGRPQPYKLKNNLIMTPNELDTLLLVQIGEKKVIDIVLKALKNGNANGNVKIDLKDLLKADGQLKSTKGKGTGQLVVDFVKIGNKIKTDSQFNIAAPTYDVDLTIYPQYEKDNSKKISLSTHNKITEDSIDSK